MKINLNIMAVFLMVSMLLTACSEEHREGITEPLKNAAEDVSASAGRAKEASQKAINEVTEASKVVAKESVGTAKTTVNAAVSSGSAAVNAAKETAKKTAEEVNVNLDIMEENIKSDLYKASATLHK